MNMSEFSAEFIAAAARKPQFYFLLDFSELKTLGQVLDLSSFQLVSGRNSTNPADWFLERAEFSNTDRYSGRNPSS